VRVLPNSINDPTEHSSFGIPPRPKTSCTEANLVRTAKFPITMENSSNGIGQPMAVKLAEMRKQACLSQGLPFEPNSGVCPNAWTIQYVPTRSVGKGDYIRVLWAQTNQAVIHNGKELTISVPLAHKWVEAGQADAVMPPYDLIVGRVTAEYPDFSLIACRQRVGIAVNQTF